MPVHQLSDMTWEEVRDADLARSVAILPVGAVEAHGPHLPLGTDGIIAEAMARESARLLSDQGRTAFVLPTVWYTAAPFAEAFPGTISVQAETVRRLIGDIGASLSGQGIPTLAIANAHLDPAHVGALRTAEREPAEGIRVVFADLTRRANAARMTEEFKTGACHAGRYEGSVVLAEEPRLVRTEIAEALDPNPNSLSEAIGQGAASFADAGGDRAYFGWPAEATAAEGQDTVKVLGALLAEAVLNDEGGR